MPSRRIEYDSWGEAQRDQVLDAMLGVESEIVYEQQYVDVTTFASVGKSYIKCSPIIVRVVHEEEE